jgi:hypothetical protein
VLLVVVDIGIEADDGADIGIDGGVDIGIEIDSKHYKMKENTCTCVNIKNQQQKHNFIIFYQKQYQKRKKIMRNIIHLFVIITINKLSKLRIEEKKLTLRTRPRKRMLMPNSCNIEIKRFDVRNFNISSLSSPEYFFKSA